MKSSTPDHLLSCPLDQEVYYWSERNACTARAALQTGCVANEVATEFIFAKLSSSFNLQIELSYPYFQLIQPPPPTRPQPHPGKFIFGWKSTKHAL
jgi:hypothetical protein